MYIVLRIFGEKNSSKHDIQNKVHGSSWKKKKLKQENQKNSRNIYQIIGKKMYNSGFSI